MLMWLEFYLATLWFGLCSQLDAEQRYKKTQDITPTDKVLYAHVLIVRHKHRTTVDIMQQNTNTFSQLHADLPQMSCIWIETLQCSRIKSCSSMFLCLILTLFLYYLWYILAISAKGLITFIFIQYACITKTSCHPGLHSITHLQ